MVTGEIILTVLTVCVLGLHILESRANRKERSLLVNALLSRNSTDFKVRQSATNTDEKPRIVTPNPREPKPQPIGLGGDW